MIPEMKDILGRVGNKAATIRVVGKNVGDLIDEIKRKVALTRDRANSVRYF